MKQRDSFESAGEQLRELTLSLQRGAGDQAAQTASASLAELETAAAELVARLKREPLEGSERRRLVSMLSELRRQAYVCAALFESQVLYLQWGQESSRAAREYTPKGRIASDRPANLKKQWEA